MAGIADEVLVTSATSPDHKRKIQDLEAEAPESTPVVAEDHAADADSESPDTKRPRFDGNSDASANENGCEEKRLDEPQEEGENGQPATTDEPREENEQVTADNPRIEDAETQAKDADDAQNTLHSNCDGAALPSVVDSSELDHAQAHPNEEADQASEDVTQQGDVSEQQQQPSGDGETMSRQIEVPNTKVGVLIGKGGETIRYLQYNSGAKIQIVRDVDADLESPVRPVEIVGSLESIDKAEKLIKDVIAEAEAGGSPALIARGVTIAPGAGSGDQIEIKVPNDKVGLIIGKGGETIKGLQTRSGARIQLIPQHLPEGGESKERIVRVTGDKRQIDIAREMIKDVMRQQKPSTLSGGGFTQQPNRPRGPSGPPQWGPRPPYSAQPMAYDYQYRGPYPPHNSQYGPPPPSYNSNPQQQMPPRGGFGPSWDQRNPNVPQGPPPPHGSYDYYSGGHGSHVPNPQGLGPIPGPGVGPQQQPQANYNVGPPQGADYGHHWPPYPQAGPPQQGYSHNQGYNAPPPPGPQYGTSQPMYPQAGPQHSYGQNYKPLPPPSYSAQQPPPQYGNSRPGGEMGYSGHNQGMTSQPPQQQPYQYPSTEPAHMQQQSYPMYGGSAPVATDGGPQTQQHHYQSAPAPVSRGYSSYPAPQQGYPEQQQQQQPWNQQDGGYGAAPNAAYGTAPAQPVYDQSGGYVAPGELQPPATAPPQYDSTPQQVYGAPR